MQCLQKSVSTAAVALIAAANVPIPAGAAGTRRHHAFIHHRYDGYRDVARHGRAPVYAPPGYVDAGVFGLAGPQGTGLLGHGGVLGTGVSNGEGLLGIGFFGL